MAIKQIVIDTKIMHQACDPCPADKDLVDEIITDLVDTINDLGDKAVGLAANQIGYPYRVVLVRDGIRGLIMINPAIVSAKGKISTTVEGCLSRPGVTAMVPRIAKIKVEFVNGSTGQAETRTFRQYMARVVQHELDHLNGELIDDPRPGGDG